MKPWLERPSWLPVEAPLKGLLPRVRGVFLAVVAQFELETASRYQRTKAGATKCNIASWDITRAMGAEIPHWVDTAGNPVSPGKGAELNANMTLDWLRAHGQRFGWAPCYRDDAADAAEKGEPAVAAWANPDRKKPGHIAVCVPAIEAGVLHIAQAGSSNFTSAPIAKGFGAISPEFYRHG